MESASFAIPTVNIGLRQKGRERARNVLDAPADTAAILARVAEARSPAFRASLQGMTNPYGDGQRRRAHRRRPHLNARSAPNSSSSALSPLRNDFVS